VLRAVAILSCAALCLAACGGSKHTSATQGTTTVGSCVNAAAMKKLRADVAAIKHASNLPTKSTFGGNPAINKATDKFLLDVNTAKIDNKRKNRMIDLAMGSLANQCEQCFQALEAGRPIPGLRYGETGCGA
jgi:cytochrome c556